MIKVTINKTSAKAQNTEPLTSGMIGKQVEVLFDASWDGLLKTAVFTNGVVAKDVLENSPGWNGNIITIPHEVLATAEKSVSMSVYGYTQSGDNIVLAMPSIYAPIGQVLYGSNPEGDESSDPSLPVYAQLHWMIEHFSVSPEQIAEQLAEYFEENPMQEPIADLEDIRAGAEAGATALQPEALNDYETAEEAEEKYQSRISVAQFILPANGWDDNEQTVSVSGVKADETAQFIDIFPASADYNKFLKSGIICIGQGANTLTFSCFVRPSSDISVIAKIEEV